MAKLRSLLVGCLILVTLLTWGQPPDLKKITHPFFISYFSTTKHIPIVVNYTLTKDMVTCSHHFPRLNNYVEDPLALGITDLNDDYPGTNYDKGHNMSAEDNVCNKSGMDECFYFSNMTPQTHHLNAGVWKSVEAVERSYAEEEGKIIVFTGSVGKIKTIGAHKVVVPKYMWKMIYHTTSRTYESYWFPNTTTTKQPFSDYGIKIKDLQKKIGIVFHGGKMNWEAH
jgi:endonuclease G